jgi:hypothetical protein
MYFFCPPVHLILLDLIMRITNQNQSVHLKMKNETPKLDNNIFIHSNTLKNNAQFLYKHQFPTSRDCAAAENSSLYLSWLKFILHIYVLLAWHQSYKTLLINTARLFYHHPGHCNCHGMSRHIQAFCTIKLQRTVWWQEKSHELEQNTVTSLHSFTWWISETRKALQVVLIQNCLEQR